MTTYSAITNSEIAVGAPVTNNLKTKERDNLLAIQENDASAPTIAYATLAGSVSADSVAPSTDLIDTITTEGSQSIGVGANWTPSQGLYNLVDASAISITSVLALFVSAAWRSGSSNISGLLLADGTNMRIDNVHGSTSAAVYWQRFDG